MYKIDYQETFAPVVKMNSVRVLISLVGAFLHGGLEESGFQYSRDKGKNYVDLKRPCMA